MWIGGGLRFAVNTLFGTLGGTRFTTAMAKPSDASEVGTHNVVKATMEHLSENQKNDVEKLTQSFRELCLDSFVINRTGGARQVTPFPKPMMVGEASDTTQGPSAAVIHELVNQAVHHALINQSGVLVNTLQNLIKQTVEGAVHKESTRGRPISPRQI